MLSRFWVSCQTKSYPLDLHADGWAWSYHPDLAENQMSGNHDNGEEMARKWAEVPQSALNATSVEAHSEFHKNLAVIQCIQCTIAETLHNLCNFVLEHSFT